MKKIICMILAILLISSASVMIASAEVVEGWEMAGDITAPFVANAEELITFDGDFSDMIAAGANSMTLDRLNMCAWAGEVPEKWSIEFYTLADAEYLYIGFWIKDEFVSYNKQDDYLFSDAFQMGLDFLDMNEENDLDVVFYSFGLQETEDIQLVLDKQRARRDADVIYYSDDAKEVRGCAILDAIDEGNATGWKAEFAFSWEMLLDDLNYKLAAEQKETVEAFDLKNGITIDMLLAYVDHTGYGFDTVTNAFATTSKWEPKEGIDWSTTRFFYAENAGLSIKVKTEDSVIINCADNREEDTDEETSSTEEATSTGDETTTELTTTTEAATTTTVAAETTVATTDKPKNNDKPGCKSVVTGALVLLTSISLAGVALKKKH